VQNATTIQSYIDSVVMVSKTRTISVGTSLRHKLREQEERLPAGV
jgi:hypothetical protein